MGMTYSHKKFKVNVQLVPKIEWKQTDGGNCITSHADAVDNYTVQLQQTYCTPLTAAKCPSIQKTNNTVCHYSCIECDQVG